MRTFRIIRVKDNSVVAVGKVTPSGKVDLSQYLTIKRKTNYTTFECTVYLKSHYENLQDCLLACGRMGKNVIEMDDTKIVFSDIDLIRKMLKN